jgi:hypothetical protein
VVWSAVELEELNGEKKRDCPENTGKHLLIFREPRLVWIIKQGGFTATFNFTETIGRLFWSQVFGKNSVET